MTLHDRIRAVVEERLRLAREVAADCEPEWYRYERYILATSPTPAIFHPDDEPVLWLAMDGTEPLMEHVAANDPADAILSAEHALSVLERHRPGLIGGCGADCREWYPYPDPEHVGPPDDGEWRSQAWPCIEIRELATRWRVEVDG